MVERRLSGGFQGRFDRQFHNPAAMALQKRCLGKLEWTKLEHGFRRRIERALRSVARVQVHDCQEDTVYRREALFILGRWRKLQCPGAGVGGGWELGNELGQR